jgi:hypothetical protein
MVVEGELEDILDGRFHSGVTSDLQMLLTRLQTKKQADEDDLGQPS